MAKTFFNKTIYVVFLDDIEKAEIPNALLNWWIELMQYQCLFRSKYDSDAALAAALVAAVNYNVSVKFTLIDEDGNRHPLDQKVSFIGREERKCSILLRDRMVSRIHCCILYQNGQLFIQDLGAANGTWVNSHQIFPGTLCELQPGDVIMLGSYRLTVSGADDSEA